jgi:hypothetical protein
MSVGELFECEPEGRTGDWSISIRQEGWGSRGYWYTVLDGVKPQRWYAVSLWAKRDRPTGWVPEIELFGQRRVMNLRPPDVWQRFDWLLHSGQTSGNAVLKLMNSRKPSKVWFDDVAIEEVTVELASSTEGRMLSWRSPSTSRLVVFEVEVAKSGILRCGNASPGKNFETGVFFSGGVSAGRMVLASESVSQRFPANSVPAAENYGRTRRVASAARVNSKGVSPPAPPGDQPGDFLRRAIGTWLWMERPFSLSASIRFLRSCSARRDAPGSTLC